MDTADRPTCGKGLAENSILPATLSSLVSAMAENLAVHMKALDLTDTRSQDEYSAYEKLVKELRESAVSLQWAANEMAGYRNLPMGRHDEVAMTRPEVRQAFEKLVTHKQELLVLLQQTTQRDNQLLEIMRTESTG